jgi:hypothetical protein
MKKTAFTFLLIAMAFALAGCRSRTDRAEGTVLLSVSDFDELPVGVSVSGGPTSIGEITLRNVSRDPSGNVGPLQDIELLSYEVRYVRLDTGTRQPPGLVESLFGNVPVNGNAVFNNLPFLRQNQLLSQPLSDLADFGTDQQTGSRLIPLRVTLRFFGRTLSGDDIVSEPASFDIEVVP